MSNETVINPNISNSTVINPEIGQATAINPVLAGAAAARIPAGTVLAGKYEIVETLSASTGEADLYSCR